MSESFVYSFALPESDYYK